MMQRKGSYFFVIDAFIGSIIIITAIIIATTQFSAKSVNTATYYSAEDFLSIQETTQIRDYGYTNKTSDNTEDDIHKMVRVGQINNTQNTLLQQIVLFYMNGETNNAVTMTRAIVDNTPTTSSIEVYITTPSTQTFLLANKTRTPYKDANSVVSSQRIIIAKKNSMELYPPTIIEVRTWQ
jgi:hypothetical protein